MNPFMLLGWFLAGLVGLAFVLVFLAVLLGVVDEFSSRRSKKPRAGLEDENKQLRAEIKDLKKEILFPWESENHQEFK